MSEAVTGPTAPAAEAQNPEAPSAAPKRGVAARLWDYQAERFPIVRHGVLIAAFGASAVCLSALLRQGTPDVWAIVVAVFVLFGLFFQLRVADEHKDNEEDSRFRPERPVPRGLVTLAELRTVAFVVAVAQIAMTVRLDWRLLGPLALVWAWMAIMTKEFFVPKWLKARPIVYMVSHMAIMPLIDLYATACDWLPASNEGGMAGHKGFGLTLGAFLLLSLVNGTVIELARKSWAPEQEREGVETYSKLWGPGYAGAAVLGVVLVGLAIAAFVNVRSDGGTWMLAGLLAVGAYASWAAIEYAGGARPGNAKAMETASGVYVAANYLLLGVLPLIGSQFA